MKIDVKNGKLKNGKSVKHTAKKQNLNFKTTALYKKNDEN